MSNIHLILCGKVWVLVFFYRGTTWRLTEIPMRQSCEDGVRFRIRGKFARRKDGKDNSTRNDIRARD